MAEFPPNLGDGELFLPSDVFLNEIPCKHNHPSLLTSSSCMDEFDLAHHFATLSLLRNRSSIIKPLYTQPTSSFSQWVKPAVRGVPVDHVTRGYFGMNESGGGEGSQRLRGGTGHLLARSEPVYEFKVRPRVDGHLETTSARVLLKRQQNRVPSRVYPFQGRGAGVGLRGGGFGRESGGTGVFHPRIVVPSTSTDDRKKQGGGTKQGVQVVAQQRNPMKRFGVSKQQEDCYYHLPPEMGLPRDWTY